MIENLADISISSINEPFLEHLKNGDGIAFLGISMVFSLFLMFCYKKNNKSDVSILWLFFFIYGLFIVIVGIRVTSLFFSIVILLILFALMLKPVCVLNILICAFGFISRNFNIPINFRTKRELVEEINCNKIFLCSLIGIFIMVAVSDLEEAIKIYAYFVGDDQIKDNNYFIDYSVMVGGVIGAISYIVFMYKFISYTKYWLLAFALDLFLIIHICFGTYMLFSSKSYSSICSVILVDACFNMYMIGIVGSLIVLKIMNIAGSEERNYFEILFWSCVGYCILKTYLEFSFSYYVYDSMVAVAKNVIDSTLQVCFIGSLFAYAGYKIGSLHNENKCKFMEYRSYLDKLAGDNVRIGKRRE